MFPQIAQLSKSGNTIKRKHARFVLIIKNQFLLRIIQNNSGNQEMIWAIQFFTIYMGDPVGDPRIWAYSQHCQCMPFTWETFVYECLLTDQFIYFLYSNLFLHQPRIHTWKLIQSWIHLSHITFFRNMTMVSVGHCFSLSDYNQVKTVYIDHVHEDMEFSLRRI